MRPAELDSHQTPTALPKDATEKQPHEPVGLHWGGPTDEGAFCHQVMLPHAGTVFGDAFLASTQPHSWHSVRRSSGGNHGQAGNPGLPGPSRSDEFPVPPPRTHKSASRAGAQQPAASGARSQRIAAGLASPAGEQGPSSNRSNRRHKGVRSSPHQGAQSAASNRSGSLRHGTSRGRAETRAETRMPRELGVPGLEAGEVLEDGEDEGMDPGVSGGEGGDASRGDGVAARRADVRARNRIASIEHRKRRKVVLTPSIDLPWHFLVHALRWALLQSVAQMNGC